MLWSISKLYQGNQGISQYFFDGLNRHRHKLIWILAGVEMTSDIYKKISISLFTIIITALIYSIRGSYFMQKKEKEKKLTEREREESAEKYVTT